jgi:hypothetical protein
VVRQRRRRPVRSGATLACTGAASLRSSGRTIGAFSSRLGEGGDVLGVPGDIAERVLDCSRPALV